MQVGDVEQLGTLAAIWRYPVKSLRGISLDETDVGERGLPDDRASALFVRSGNLAREGKTLRGKEHDRLHLLDSADAAVTAAAERGIAVDVRNSEERYFDLCPISLIVDRWLDGVSAAVGYRVEPLRFRPNFFVKADPAFTGVEADLVGATIEIGTVRFVVRKPIERCVVPSYDLNGGAPDRHLQRYIVQERENVMGIYGEAVQPGHVRTGDAVRFSLR